MNGRHRVVAALVIGALAVTACGAPGTSPSPSASAVASSSTSGSTASSAPTVGASTAPTGDVVWWSMYAEGEPHQVNLAAGIAACEAANPGLKVKVNWAGREVVTALQGALAAGTAVDIVDQSNSRLYNALVRNDLALPLDDYLAGAPASGSGTWKGTFTDGAFDTQKGPDGKIYMIPRDDYMRAVFYNRAILKDAGITPALTGMTWDEFKSILSTLKAKGVSPLGFDNDPEYDAFWFFNLAVRLAGLEAVQAASVDKTGAAWDDPAFLDAAKKVQELVDGGYFQKGFEGSVWPAAQVGWATGKNAMMLMGSWLPSEMSDQLPKGFEIGMFAFPNVPGGKGNDLSEHWSNSYAVLAGSKNPDGAVAVLKCLTTPTVAAALAGSGSASPLKGIPAAPGLENQAGILAAVTSMNSTGGFSRDTPDWENKVFRRCNDEFLLKHISPEAFIKCLKEEGIAYWKAN